MAAARIVTEILLQKFTYKKRSEDSDRRKLVFTRFFCVNFCTRLQWKAEIAAQKEEIINFVLTFVMLIMDLSEQVERIQNKILNYKKAGYEQCITSSFQSHSLPLLHIVSRAIPDLPVLFIDTGYHFPETYAFRNEIADDWGLNLVNVRSKTAKNQQIDMDGQFLFSSSPEQCCHINKVEPLDDAMRMYDIWIAGLRRDQTSHRSGLQEEEFQENGLVKYHPILEWNSKMIYDYAQEHSLPKHPLEAKGYLSIGCMPCTNSISEDMERSGRWYGSKKTECGIHLSKS